MSRPRPMFPYYGAKWRATLKYADPTEKLIIEPFAGSACYALHHHEGHDVWINDTSEIVYGVWDYLKHVSDEEFDALPVNVNTVHSKKLKPFPQEAKDLIGFWFTKGTTVPAEKKVGWARKGTKSYKESYAVQYWSAGRKQRIKSQLGYIRDWRITCADYRDIPNQKATWFIDPPYFSVAGKAYDREVSNVTAKGHNMDYDQLASWCKSRDGQKIVCESTGADWLPFVEFGEYKTTRKGRLGEVVWPVEGKK